MLAERQSTGPITLTTRWMLSLLVPGGSVRQVHGNSLAAEILCGSACSPARASWRTKCWHTKCWLTIGRLIPRATIEITSIADIALGQSPIPKWHPSSPLQADSTVRVLSAVAGRKANRRCCGPHLAAGSSCAGHQKTHGPSSWRRKASSGDPPVDHGRRGSLYGYHRSGSPHRTPTVT